MVFLFVIVAEEQWYVSPRLIPPVLYRQHGVPEQDITTYLVKQVQPTLKFEELCTGIGKQLALLFPSLLTGCRREMWFDSS